MTSPTPAPPAPRVLVIDDEASILAIVARVLTKAGFAVVTAASVEEAEPQLDGADLVLCDEWLPGKSGSALLESVRARGLPTPFILMSGGPTADRVVTAFESGVSAVLLKPFSIDDLVHRVRVALETRTRP